MSTAEQDDVPTMLDRAKRYRDRGWRPFPVRLGRKDPVARMSWPTATASAPSDKTLELWFGREPVNIGIAARGSGLVFIDEDVPGGMAKLCEAYGHDAPETYRVHTREGRQHWYFNAPEGIPITNVAGLLKTEYGLDVRGTHGGVQDAGGYVVAAGSVHETGAVYAELDPAADTVELPWWLTDLLLGVQQAQEEEPATERPPGERPESERRFTRAQAEAFVARFGVDRLKAAREGDRNNKLNECSLVVGHFVPALWDEVTARKQLTEYGLAAGLDRDEVRKTITSGLKAGMRTPYAIVEDDATGTAGESRPDSSWRPVDLAAEWDDDAEPERPTLLPREDGPCLLYPGRTHSIYGESESGKSWIALILVAQVLREDGTALYIDHESDRGPIKARLRALGVTRKMAARLTYVRPDGPRDGAWLDLLEQRFTVAVVDGVSVAIATDGSSSDSTDETAPWLEQVPRALEQRTGAAVLTIDHVTKARDGRGRFAVGSQAKLNAISGAAYTARVHKPFGRGETGELVLRITKDRPGGIRPECGPAGEHGTQEAARVVLDATDPLRIKAAVRKWSESGDEKHDLPFGEPIEKQTSWREDGRPLPADITDYRGPGAASVPDLARFMRKAADGGIGQSLTDAKRELMAVKNLDGTPRHNKWGVQRAWGVLLGPDLKRLETQTDSDTGRALWRKRDGE